MGYRIKYSAVLRLLQLQIRRSRKVYTQLLTELQNANVAYLKKIQLFGFSAFPDGTPS